MNELSSAPPPARISIIVPVLDEAECVERRLAALATMVSNHIVTPLWLSMRQGGARAPVVRATGSWREETDPPGAEWVPDPAT